jgi:CubicO group peptidase (beta-lactamase class C family)
MTRDGLQRARNPRTMILVAVAAMAGAATATRSTAHHESQEIVMKPFAWRVSKPENEGVSSSKLGELKDRLAAKGTKALLVIRNDAIVYEWYSADHAPTRTHYTASMAKALVGGVSLGVALSDGRLALDDAAAKYVPQWNADARKRRITLRQLGSHTSGIEDAEADELPHEKLTGWKGDFWKRLEPPNDPFTISRDITPVLFEPGERLQYSNPGIAMLTYAVTAAIQGSRWPDIRTLLRDRVMRPIGAADEEWSIGYGRTFVVAAGGGQTGVRPGSDRPELPLVASWGGGGYTARATARVGRLMLRGGDWDGTRLLSESAVKQITTDAGTPGHGGIGWWSNAEGKYPALPRDAFWGSGAGHQVLFVVPSRRLVAVRNGASLGSAMEHHDVLNSELFAPLLDAIAPDPPPKKPPYPASPALFGIEWAPVKDIVRLADGSDNFPMTWGEDDALYAAYGDGWGFEPRVPEKLSLGLVRVSGPADRPIGTNVRSPTLEQKGDGAAGKKASGILMVDGILYLWARNADNSQLAWSADRGQTWTWSDWRFDVSFGSPTFLNFGRNYAGARDEFVYVFSHDADSAYTPADRMVLARVPKDRIRDRAAYEFFTGLDSQKRPAWSRDIAQRGGVFTYPGNCYRSGITFNAGLRRYLWSQTLPGTDARFRGGFGVYDAPEPWGPWTTVYFTNEWDVGPGETSSFPTKWMSADGRTLHLVFSGADAFSVRKATLLMPDDRRRRTPSPARTAW